MKYRLGVLATHPVQYYSAWFRHLARVLDLEVFYAHRQDAQGQAAAGFGVEFEWDTPLLEGYSHHWLVNRSRRPGLGTFGGCDTPEIPERIREIQPHAWLFLGWNYKSALQGIWACRRQGIPVLMRGDSQLPGGRPLWKRVAKAIPYRTLLPRLDAHLYVGRRNREYLTYYGVPEQRLFFCPHCVDNGFFAREAARAAADGRARQIRKKLGIPRGDLVLLFAGKLTPQKRPLDLIHGMQAIEQRGAADVWLMVVGSGPLQKAMQDLAGDRIRFLGFQNQSQMPVFYQAADVLVLPSASESWGLVVNEAMACGRPAIVSHNVGCGPDLIQTGRTGLTYACGDVEQMADCVLTMQRLLRQSGEDIGGWARRRIAGYSMETATQGLMEALDAVTSLRSRADSASRPVKAG